ncbi:hypothetical protein GM418_01890 [Maribellus comscasis]|uniref:Uncharacterized protein n=1 Tax=Maribellus comscasis TaxID=2681766 RepID=A0A6I6JI91_9BACT|nr:hypothetical protein [Maribellus comscasis]QGY42446.1 hypothetical protein GM418_01890 [Maribellus comscasis]
MKRSVLTMATVNQGGNGGGDADNDEATHSGKINISTIALVDVESSNGGEVGTINLFPLVTSLEAGEA